MPDGVRRLLGSTRRQSRFLRGKIMPETIVRFYGDEQQAKRAVDGLASAGFDRRGIVYVEPLSENAAATATAAGMGQLATFVAEKSADGLAMVAVEPPFGRARLAIAIVDDAGPVAVELPATKAAAKGAAKGAGAGSGRDPSPLSDKLGWRVLLDNPAPLSGNFGWKLKSEKEHFLVDKLSDNPAPLSSSLGWKLKSEKEHFLVDKLSDNPAPLSSSLGWKLKAGKRLFFTTELSNNPTPLSSMLGWKVLSDKS